MFSTRKTKASAAAAAEAADMIASNDDILTVILQCLPLKSRLKFKAVSKHWLSLIADPTFRPKHYNSTTISGLFVRRRFSGRTNIPKYDFINLSPHPSRPPFRSLTFVHDPYGIKISQSCNGLLLCSTFRANGTERSYYIYNPTTNHYMVLPRLSPGPRGSSSRYNYNSVGVSLAFDPSETPHYKVICIRNHDPDSLGHYQVEIYSSKTALWRPLDPPFIAQSSVRFRNGVFWNGAIHWINDRGGDSLCFDVEEEQIRAIPMPSKDEDLRPRRYFGESGDHLHLVEVYSSDNLEFDVYEMERDHSGWFVKYKVDLNPVAASFPEMVRGYVHPIDFHLYAFSVMCVVREETDAIRYSFKDNSFRKVQDFAQLGSRVGLMGANNNSFEFECFEAYQFIESFACV